MYGFRFYVPIVNPMPFRTMLTRLNVKLNRIAFRITNYYVLPYFKISGAKDRGVNSDGNHVLSINSEKFLGKKNTLINMPKDSGLYEYVRVTGEWQLKECYVLADALDKSALSTGMIPTFVDIGANVGLISLQVANIVKSRIKIQAVEPLPRHYKSILSNLETAQNIDSIKIWPVAISKDDGVAEIYSEKNHFGNTSLDKKSMGKHKFKTEKIETLSALKIFSEMNKDLTRFVVKVDTQGHDLFIISAIPEEMLQKTDCILVEVWPQKGISKKQVERIDSICSMFSDVFIMDKPQVKLNANDVKNIWLSESNKTVDLVFQGNNDKSKRI